jgi:Ca2+-binding RTX toxin-like protein
MGFLAAGSAALVACALCGQAAADVTVTFSGADLEVAVKQKPGQADGNHGIAIGRFQDADRDGFRVGQLALGNPTISSSSSRCDTNGLFNDVVCDGTTTSVGVTGGDGDDKVVFKEPNVPASSCFAVESLTSHPLAVSLGPGTDELDVEDEDEDCPGGTIRLDSFHPAITAFGGSGTDTLNGGIFGDTLSGNDGGDVLRGAGGADTLNGGDGRDQLLGGAGDDHLAGGGDGDFYNGGDGTDEVTDYVGSAFQIVVTVGDGGGNGPFNDGRLRSGGSEGDDIPSNVERVFGGNQDDRLTGTSGHQELVGNPGNDILDGGSGPDTLNGGGGFDTADYADRTARIFVTVGPGAATGDDGAAGEGDTVDASVEHVIGGLSADRLTGLAGFQLLEGGPGGDVIDAGAGDDRVLGGANADVLIAGPGEDSADAGDGVDSVDLRDGEPDSAVDCGRDADSVLADLQDKAVRFTNCERVDFFAVDDGPPARLVTRRVRITPGHATVRLACPTAALVDCRGRLKLRGPARRAATLASARYSVPLGHSRLIHLRLRTAVGRALRERHRAVVATTETGVSSKGPRSTRTVVAVP